MFDTCELTEARVNAAAWVDLYRLEYTYFNWFQTNEAKRNYQAEEGFTKKKTKI